MAKLINFITFKDARGALTVIEKNVPFNIKRVFYIYNVDDSKRGFHKHKKTIQLAISLNGSCDIVVDNGLKKIIFQLDSPDKGLIIEPDDYHWMENFSKGTVLLVLASQEYDPDDYIYQNH
jgi:dTDP-4-dehydrorhamnose 3,5-epimerase-like enzyme